MTKARGTGTVYSWVVAHHAFDPVLADAVPYIAALINLDEGARVYARLVDVADRDLVAGLPVQWSASASRVADRPLLVFRPTQPTEQR